MSCALDTLRHALADPLSAAGLKLEYVARRLAKLSADEDLAGRIQTAKADLAVAGRLIDLLPRLARVVAEAPEEASVGEICLAAGIALGDGASASPRLTLRRRATVDALRAVSALFRPAGLAAPAPLARVEVGPERVSLLLVSLEGRLPASPDRLFSLPRDEERPGELFLARACVESDGGALRLVEEEARLLAQFSWPAPAASGSEGAVK
ncbi:MAG: hypothetical protein ACYDBY_13895 [Thermoanaerobaculia bacterium]